MYLRTTCLTLAALLTVPLAASAQEKIDIKFRKPTKGDVTLVEKKDTEETKTLILDNAGKVLQDLSQPKKVTNYAYRETTLAVGADDKATKLTRQYTKAETSDKGEAVAPLPYEGKTVLIEKKGDRYTFQIEGGGELTGKDAEKLDSEFNPKKKGGPDFEKMLLPGRPVAVGETWKLDTRPLVEEMKKSDDVVVDFDKMVMTAKLVRAYKKGGRQFGVIRVDWVVPIKAFKGGGKETPLEPGAKMVVVADMDVCIDGTAYLGTMTGDVRMDMAFPVPDMPQLRATAQMRGNHFEKRSPPTK
jgi:hypothetical protein